MSERAARRSVGGRVVTRLLPWGRKPDRPVSAVALSGRAYLHHPRDGVLEVASGRTTEDQFVHATIDEPRRWFVEFRSVDVPQGVWAMILWEVGPDVGQRALGRRAAGYSDTAPVIEALNDVKISTETEWIP